MKYEINHRLTNEVLFEADIPDDTPQELQTLVVLEKATKAYANLAGANLAGANLAGERPIFQIGPIGSRSAYLMAFMTGQGVILKTGCFAGSVAAFEERLQAEHGDNKHAQEYRAALALIDVYARLWAPKVD